MKAEYINPFVDSTLNVLSTMAFTDSSPGAPSLKKDNLTKGAVTGLIGMAGSEINGNMILSFEKATILSIVSKMVMEEFSEINDDVTDAVGELTNMISGGAKKLLSEHGLSFDMATPIMIVGQNVELKQLSDHPVISIDFTTDSGKFWVEANLASA